MKVSADIEKLINRQLSGIASAADTSLLEQWRGQSEENEQAWLSYQEAWQEFPGQLSHEAAWEKFRVRHFDDNKQQRGWPIYLKYAAAAAVLLGLFLTGRYFTGSDTYLTGSGEAMTIDLADGTIVRLYENSQLDVPRSFGWRSRELGFRGRAGFDVARDERKAFMIHSPQTGVQVLGTSFMYEDREGQSSLLVAEGKVAYWLEGSRDTLILTRGQVGELSGGELTQSLATGDYESWLKGEFSFKDERLIVVLRKLQEYYTFDLITNTALESSQCRFTGDFSGQPLETVLEELSLTMDFKYEFQDGVLSISEINCR